MSTTRRDSVTTRTRTAVLAAASELLLDRGVGAVTIDAVVQRSGVARSTIYRHWPTRADVVAATVDGLIHPPPPVPPPGPLVERLNAVCAPVVDAVSDPNYARLASAVLGEISLDPDLRGFRERFAAAQTAPVRTVLADAVAQGELPADTDIDEAVSLLVGPVIVHCVLQGRVPGQRLVQQTIEGFVRSRATSARVP